MTRSSLVHREDDGPIVILTLNRADKRNALSRALLSGLSDILDEIAAEEATRVVIFTGAGPTFCAGMDLAEAAELGSTPEAETRAVQDVKAIAHLVNQVHKFPRPTIACLQGDAFAGGAGLAVACDFILMAEHARLGYPEVKRGLVASIVMHDLIRQVGDRRARELLLTGQSIDAATAERWGLANRVVPAATCREEALALGRSLLAAAPIALATTKRLIDEAAHRPDDLRGAAAISAAVRIGDEALEGMNSFLEKRPPSWMTS